MTFSFPGRHLLCAAALLAAAAAGAEPVTPAKLLPAQSQIVFVSRQMGVPVEGSFKKFDAQVAFDPRKPEGGSVALQIEVASASLGIPQSDAELPKAAWFDSHALPQGRVPVQHDQGARRRPFEIAGKLTIKGAPGRAGAGRDHAVGRPVDRDRKPHDPAPRLQDRRRRMDRHRRWWPTTSRSASSWCWPDSVRCEPATSATSIRKLVMKKLLTSRRR